MNYPYGLLPEAWHWSATILLVLLLLLSLYSAPWQRLKDDELLHAYLGTCVVLILLWSIRTTSIPGLDYHFLGATLLTLMFGWQLAFLGINIVLLGTIANGTSDWQSYALNVLIMGMFPVIISHLIYRVIERRLPRHFFIYIFMNAFFGAAIALTLAILVAALILILGGVYSSEQLSYLYFPFLPLMLFPEAFITGMLMTIMVVMRPQWVTTFDDAQYLQGK